MRVSKEIHHEYYKVRYKKQSTRAATQHKRGYNKKCSIYIQSSMDCQILNGLPNPQEAPQKCQYPPHPQVQDPVYSLEQWKVLPHHT